METWQLQEAKNKFSKMFDKALTEGPQLITRRGKDEAILVARSEYEKNRKPEKTLWDALMSMPKLSAKEHQEIFGGIEASRKKFKARKVDL
jgi:prevent-host-death family protein